MSAGNRVVGVSPRTAIVLALASVAGLLMLCWPLIFTPAHHSGPATGSPATDIARTLDAPLIFLLILPILIAIVLAEISSGGIDAKALAMLGVLSAINAALRPLGAGTAGVETVFFVVILAGRVFGPGFGFVLGSTSLFASALLTAGVGPWLPFQMLSTSWIGLGAGLLPRRVRGKTEIAMLAGYGVISAYAFGALMNLWSWPFRVGADTGLSFVPAAPLLDNLHRFAVYLSISSLGWDTGRAITNAVAITVTGTAILASLRRAHRRAAFEAPVSFETRNAPAIPVSAPAKSKL